MCWLSTFAPVALGILSPDEPGGLSPEPGVPIADGLFRPLGLALGVAGSGIASLGSISSNMLIYKYHQHIL